jgi:heme exporter protein A
MLRLRDAAAETPALELDGIAHRFGSRWILRGCAMRIMPGEAVALIGGNGAGKTTLLRVAATLLRPTRGEAKVLGHDIRRSAAQVREHIGMMGYSAGLYEDLTAAENLRFAVKMRGESTAAAGIPEVLEEVGLARHADARVRGFSSGMRRRLALARVLLHPPKLLFLDEPYAALDEEGVERINEVVLRIKGQGGAVLAATHDLPIASRVMERTVRLEAGILHEIEPRIRVVSATSPEWDTDGIGVATCR